MLGTVRGKEGPFVKAQFRWQLKAQDQRGHEEKVRFDTRKSASDRLLCESAAELQREATAALEMPVPPR